VTRHRAFHLEPQVVGVVEYGVDLLLSDAEDALSATLLVFCPS
jgi:hypothetical protein